MSRLTEKVKNTNDYIRLATKDKQEFINKLGRLEDSENRIGCPLEVREQAFDNGFYDIDGNHYHCEHYVPYLKAMHTRGIMANRHKSFKLSDYKKTWWLKADKSE